MEEKLADIHLPDSPAYDGEGFNRTNDLVKSAERGPELISFGDGFRVDTEKMRRKLSADAAKLWKHRVSLIWKEFEVAIIITSCGLISGLLNWHFAAGQRDDIRAYIAFMSALIGAIFLPVAVGAIYVGMRKLIYDPLLKIRKGWNADSLSEKISKMEESD